MPPVIPRAILVLPMTFAQLNEWKADEKAEQMMITPPYVDGAGGGIRTHATSRGHRLAVEHSRHELLLDESAPYRSSRMIALGHPGSAQSSLGIEDYEKLLASESSSQVYRVGRHILG